MDRLFLMIGALSGATGVAAGAFGAHALRDKLEPRLLEVFETGARYQMYHALALLAVGLVASRWPSGIINSAGWLFVAGTLFFTGSLYAMAFTGVRALGVHSTIGALARRLSCAGTGLGSRTRPTCPCRGTCGSGCGDVGA